MEKKLKKEKKKSKSIINNFEGYVSNRKGNHAMQGLELLNSTSDLGDVFNLKGRKKRRAKSRAFFETKEKVKVDDLETEKSVVNLRKVSPHFLIF